ncbi:unnamed protein product [Symbiodinium necroappetens]|uniref:Uncharacterized protein n=1 Tax=Symbiodinium necroappetens TaxID=1628268 RepID=A0A812KLT0_9DINO|nr:unnamed protein product [Symbiodinium necroappetens]
MDTKSQCCITSYKLYSVTVRLHKKFKDHVLKKGFKACHVGSNNYMHWRTDFFTSLPAILMKEALQDEWKKAVGRIPPDMSNVFIRFKVNSNVNYVVVEHAYASFAESRKDDASFKKAMTWWLELRPAIKQAVLENYVKVSRGHDNSKDKFGNPKIKEMVKGHPCTWRSLMAPECVQDIKSAGSLSDAALEVLTVDEVMSLALTEITGKLLRIYAFSAFDAGVTPNPAQCRGYVSGSSSNPPLDFYQFPRLLGDVSVLKKEVVGNPMYDTSAVLMALCALSATKPQVDIMLGKIAEGSILSSSERDEVLVRAFRGEDGPSKVQTGSE